jgi:hypothetical protein
LGCPPAGRGRGIGSVEVEKIGFGVTIDSVLNLPELLETEVVATESLPFEDSRGAEDYARALAACEFHSILL